MVDVTGGVEGVRVWVADWVVMYGKGVGEKHGAGGDDVIFVVEGRGREAFDSEGIAGAEAEGFFDGGAADNGKLTGFSDLRKERGGWVSAYV